MKKLLRELEQRGKDHIAETNFSGRFEHTLHVFEMMGYALAAIITSIPHAIHPGVMPGVARNIMFKHALFRQLKSRPSLLKDLQKEYEESLK